MSGQTFTTRDVLRIEIEATPTGLVNLVANPSGDLGSWGWVTPVPNTVLSKLTITSPGVPPVNALRFSTSASQACHVRTELMPVDGGFVGGRALYSAATSVETRSSFEFYDAAKTLLSTSSLSREWAGGGGWQQKSTQASQVPAGAAYVALRLDPHPPGTSTMVLPSGASFSLREVTIVNAATKSVVENFTPYIEPVHYRDITGPTITGRIRREDLNVGTCDLVIADASLDPADDDLIRPGRRVRVLAERSDHAWEPLFVGVLLTADIEYLVGARIPARKLARISITAVDDISQLANSTRPQGVKNISDLPWVLEGLGVPWNVNGFTSQVSAATVVSTNSNASALDQIALTRDSALGEAWMSRHGILQARDRSHLPTASLATIGSNTYSDCTISWSAADCINEVTIKLLRPNLATGETVEVTHGPYRDAASQQRWGRCAATFTVHGLPDAALDMQIYANWVLAANKTPTRRVQNVVIPIKSAANFDPAHPGTVFRDLVDRVTVTNAKAEVSAPLLVRSIEHTITPKKWTMTLGFGAVGSVAAPTLQPPIQTAPVGGWQTPALLNGWANTGGADAPVRWRVTAEGDLHIVGVVRSGSLNAAAFTLPTWARPKAAHPVASIASGGAVARVSVTPAGDVIIVTGSTAWTSLCLPPIPLT